MPSFVSPGNTSARRRIRQMYLDNRNVFAADFPLVMLWQPTMPPAGERVQEIRAPTLLVVGENDDPATVARADQMASLIAGAQKVIIAGSDHMVNMDAPVTFNQSVLAFLRSKAPGY